MISWRARGLQVLVCAALGAHVGSARALRASQAPGAAEVTVRAVEAKVPGLRTAAARLTSHHVPPERRIAEGDLFLRNKDYERAIRVFSQVDELFRQGQVPVAAHADALFLLGEAYFRSEQLLSARRRYAELLDRAVDAAYAPYTGRALSRLVDVALRVDDPAAVEGLAARLSELPDADATGSLKYARGKVAFVRRQFEVARRELAAVPTSAPYAHQSQYLLGVVFMREALDQTASTPAAVDAEPAAKNSSLLRFAAAIDQFRRVTRLPAHTDAQRHVVDLAWMAIGRLCHESDSFLDAADAYSHVARSSPEFSTMLYELAWVYVRLGDHRRAQRALEVLAITDPDRLDLADGALLRADLMLRAGEYRQALRLYEGVRNRFEPIRKQLTTFLGAHSDPAVFYDQIMNDVELVGAQPVAPIVLTWAREEAADANVFAVTDDIERSRTLLGDAREMGAKLDAVLSTATRAKAFPEIRSMLEDVIGPMNQLSRARRALALGLDDVAGSDAAGELGEVRARRRGLMSKVGRMPVNEGDFQRREESGNHQWNQLSQALQRLELQVDSLQAQVNGLRRVVDEPGQFQLAPGQPALARYRAELAANERAVAAYRQRIAEYRRAIELGRVQVGFGDQRFVADEQVRQEFAAMFGREIALAAAGRDGSRSRQYARAIAPLLERIGRAEAALGGVRVALEAEALRRSEDMRGAVARELQELAAAAAALDTLDHEARDEIGEVARSSFEAVGDRLRSIVLRADVGVVQQAWEAREEQLQRVHNLQRERALEGRKLDDELREVLDDVEESP